MAEPAGILGEIVRGKRAELERRFDGVALDALRAQARPTTRSLAAAIAQPGARFILEIKKASPSLGAIRPTADPAAIARGYAGVADALSVLTDGTHFGGSLSDLAQARREFDGPVLAKDFLVDIRQVAEARIAGADAILVMLSVLDDERAGAMIGEARRIGMDALVEVHDEQEMGRALALGAPLIGINNRDLRDLSIDLRTTERLAGMAPGRLLVSESGVNTRADVERLSAMVDGFLVGSSLMQSHDPAESARALVFGRVKLCGLNRLDDLPATRAATFAGLVFVEDSPRRVSLEDAPPLVQSGPKPVGVFRNAAAGHVADIARELRLHAVQLHGREDDEYVDGLKQLLPDVEVWKAVTIAGSRPTGVKGADRILFDSGAGGTGRTFDWTLVKDHPELARALIAGGIGPSNVREAQTLGAYAIDVGSGVDEAPGVKSAAKMAALFEALRPAAREEQLICA